MRRTARAPLLVGSSMGESARYRNIKRQTAYRCIILNKTFVVPAQRCSENNTMNTFENMYPFLAFRTNTANIEKQAIKLPELETGLCNVSCKDK